MNVKGERKELIHLVAKQKNAALPRIEVQTGFLGKHTHIYSIIYNISPNLFSMQRYIRIQYYTVEIQICFLGKDAFTISQKNVVLMSPALDHPLN